MTTKEEILDYVVTSPSNSNRNVLSGMLDSMEGQGADLPEVTEEDNGKVLGVAEGAWTAMELDPVLPQIEEEDEGKVLGVVNGQWDKMESSGNLIVNATWNSDSITLDKTYTEINEAWPNVKIYISQKELFMPTFYDEDHSMYYFTLGDFKTSTLLPVFKTIIVDTTGIANYYERSGKKFYIHSASGQDGPLYRDANFSQLANENDFLTALRTEVILEDDSGKQFIPIQIDDQEYSFGILQQTGESRNALSLYWYYID